MLGKNEEETVVGNDQEESDHEAFEPDSPSKINEEKEEMLKKLPTISRTMHNAL